MAESARASGRILVALTAAAARDRLALDVYRYLLGEAAPEVVGLFVEEEALLAHAGSQLAREIEMSGADRRLELAGLERQLRARSGALRRLFEAEGARLGLRAAFEVARGDCANVLSRAVERADALVADADAARAALEVWGRAGTTIPLRALLLTPGRWPQAGDVVLVVGRPADLDATAGSALDGALRLAARIGAPLSVVLAGRGEAPTAREAAARLAPLARSRGAAFAGAVTIERISTEAEARASALAASARHARLLVLPAPASLDAELVAGLVRRLRAAVMLVRGHAG
ncbi:MAG TPA: hypothetical protein VF329_03195 [Gammaproteobacteria bacterium]